MFTIFSRGLYKEWWLFLDDLTVATGRPSSIAEGPSGVQDVVCALREGGSQSRTLSPLAEEGRREIIDYRCLNRIDNAGAGWLPSSDVAEEDALAILGALRESRPGDCIRDMTVMQFNRYNTASSAILREMGALQPTWANGAFFLHDPRINTAVMDSSLIPSLRRSSVVVESHDERTILDAFKDLKWKERPTLLKGSQGLVRFKVRCFSGGGSLACSGAALLVFVVLVLGRMNPYGGEGPSVAQAYGLCFLCGKGLNDHQVKRFCRPGEQSGRGSRPRRKSEQLLPEDRCAPPHRRSFRSGWYIMCKGKIASMVHFVRNP